MKKLQQLHDYISSLKCCDQVMSYAEDIKPEFHADNLDDGFLLNYTAQYYLSGAKTDNDIIAAVVFYIAAFDRFAKPEFNTDVINNDKLDLIITVKFEEQAKLIADEKGVFKIIDKNHRVQYQGFGDRLDIESNISSIEVNFNG